MASIVFSFTQDSIDYNIKSSSRIWGRKNIEVWGRSKRYILFFRNNFSSPLDSLALGILGGNGMSRFKT
jgi:hypothetical protein